MTAVQTITRNSGSQAFSQTGQVDWVALAGLSITCPLNIATRLCKAGIGEVTVLVATNVCSSFAFPPEGQLELTNSLSQLKGYSTWSKAIFLGTGIKHVVNELITTEDGSFCVALSAALTNLYCVPYQAAQVWREISNIQHVENRPVPSIHQWESLVEPCAGSLRRSKLTSYFEMFASFLDSDRFATKAPSPARDVADALLKLGAISTASAPTHMFIGGLECAWLAAVAEVLLQLNIEVQSNEGSWIWRSSDHRAVSTPTVQAFFRSKSPDPGPSAQAISHRVCCITDGRALLEERMTLTETCVQKPTSWENILSATFHDWERMTLQPARDHFTNLLACVARHSEEYFTSMSRFKNEDFAQWWIYLSPNACLYTPNACGERLLAFARKNLPELVLSDSVRPSCELEAADLLLKMEASIAGLVNACNCTSCSTRNTVPSGNNRTCLKRMAFTIIRYLLILAPVTVCPHIPPAASSLRRLYHRTLSAGDATNVSLPTSRLALILFLFSGRLPTQHMPPHISAISFGGICVFLNVLQGMCTSPLDAMHVTVIPGHIKHQDTLYTFVKDTFDIDLRLPSYTFDGAPDLKGYQFDLFVEEQEERNTLGAYYKGICTGKDDYWIQPEGLQTCLMHSVSIAAHPAEKCEQHMIHASQYDWSYHDHSSRRASDPFPLLQVSMQCTWSTFSWKAWDMSLDDKTQWLSIDVTTAQWPGPLIMAQTGYLQRKRSSWTRDRLGVQIIQLRHCPRCLVQFAALAWANIEPSNVSATPAINSLKKQGTVNFHDSEQENTVEEILFELTPVSNKKNQPRSSRRSWKFLK